MDFHYFVPDILIFGRGEKIEKGMTVIGRKIEY